MTTNEKALLLHEQWNGKIETTLAKAKSTARQAEKILTLAINSFKSDGSIGLNGIISAVCINILIHLLRYKCPFNANTGFPGKNANNIIQVEKFLYVVLKITLVLKELF